jgi:hypothetical protein
MVKAIEEHVARFIVKFPELVIMLGTPAIAAATTVSLF